MNMLTNLNITKNIDLHPHKVSKKPELFTINENLQMTSENRSRSAMRKTWMRHSLMTNKIYTADINTVLNHAFNPRLGSGLTMLNLLNARGIT